MSVLFPGLLQHSFPYVVFIAKAASFKKIFTLIRRMELRNRVEQVSLREQCLSSCSQTRGGCLFQEKQSLVHMSSVVNGFMHILKGIMLFVVYQLNFCSCSESTALTLGLNMVNIWSLRSHFVVKEDYSVNSKQKDNNEVHLKAYASLPCWSFIPKCTGIENVLGQNSNIRSLYFNKSDFHILYTGLIL